MCVKGAICEPFTLNFWGYIVVINKYWRTT